MSTQTGLGLLFVAAITSFISSAASGNELDDIIRQDEHVELPKLLIDIEKYQKQAQSELFDNEYPPNISAEADVEIILNHLKAFRAIGTSKVTSENYVSTLNDAYSIFKDSNSYYGCLVSDTVKHLLLEVVANLLLESRTKEAETLRNSIELDHVPQYLINNPSARIPKSQSLSTAAIEVTRNFGFQSPIDALQDNPARPLETKQLCKDYDPCGVLLRILITERLRKLDAGLALQFIKQGGKIDSLKAFSSSYWDNTIKESDLSIYAFPLLPNSNGSYEHVLFFLGLSYEPSQHPVDYVWMHGVFYDDN